MKKYETKQFDLQGEEWRDLIRFPQTKGIYWISNLGRYKSLYRGKYYYSLGSKQRKGYRCVELRVNGVKIASPLIHDLVADSFIRLIDYNKEECHHKNHFTWCNRLQNLQILDQQTHTELHLPERVKKAIKCNTGRIVSQQTKRKLSEATKKFFETHDSPKKGKKMSQQSRRKMSESHKGLKQSTQTILKRSNAMKGKIVSQQTKKKMSENSKRRSRVNGKFVKQQ